MLIQLLAKTRWLNLPYSALRTRSPILYHCKNKKQQQSFKWDNIYHKFKAFTVFVFKAYIVFVFKAYIVFVFKAYIVFWSIDLCNCIQCTCDLLGDSPVTGLYASMIRLIWFVSCLYCGRFHITFDPIVYQNSNKICLKKCSLFSMSNYFCYRIPLLFF